MNIEAERFLGSVFGAADANGHRVALWSAPSKRNALYPVDAPGIVAAASQAVTVAELEDVYCRTTLLGADVSGSRGSADDTRALVALWADVDVAGPEHVAHNYPPSREVALGLVRAAVPLKPTFIVDSGNGVHAWWCFAEPWELETAEDRVKAGAFVAGFQAHLRAHFRAAGYRLDSTADLARLLRLPGTTNRKHGDAKPVTILEHVESARYGLDDFEPYVVDVVSPVARVAGWLEGDRLAETESLAARLCTADERFARTWAHDRPDLADQSASAYDLAVAALAARSCSDEQLGALVQLRRRQCNDDPDKALRGDYLARTLGKARENGGARVPTTPAVPNAVAAPCSLDQAVGTFRRWLHYPDPSPLYVVLGAVAANRFPGDPVWPLLVGPPGCGKTETLGPLTALDDVYRSGALTEASLLSGTPQRENARGAKGGLLREIGEFGILLHKDFGSVLSMQRDTRAGVLAALREIYDGSWTRHVGTDGGRTLHWSGKLGLIAGCTPEIDAHHAVMASLGERFVLHRMSAVDAEQQAGRALESVGDEERMRAELATAVAGVFAGRDLVPTGLDADERTRLIRLTSLAVRARSTVSRDSYNREVILVPEPEAPGRLARVFAQLLSGMVAVGVPRAQAWGIVEKMALDSMPALRRQVLATLLLNTNRIDTTSVAETLGYPTTTTRRALEDLAAHGLVTRRSQGAGKADLWEVDGWARDRWPTVPEMSGEPS